MPTVKLPVEVKRVLLLQLDSHPILEFGDGATLDATIYDEHRRPVIYVSFEEYYPLTGA
jgi:hypothetical protein